MSKSNRKSGLSITPAVFQALHRSLLSLFKEHYQISPETMVDYQLYGFNYYDESLPSVKRLILDKTGKWVNGKYLYNKYREWKNGGNPIQFTREFVFIYFQTLGLKDINDFIKRSSLSEAAIDEQLSLERPESGKRQNKVDYYVGYYEGEEGNIIYCKLTLYEQAEQAQIDLIYWEEEKEYSEYTYTGTIIYQQNGMSLFFKNEDTLLDRSQFIGMYCERQIKVKPFLIGTISGYDRDRRPVVGEIIFQRVNTKEELKEIIQNKKANTIIAQYLSGRRWIIDNKMIQNLNDLSPQSKHAHIIDQFVGSYKGVFVAIENGVFITSLEIKDNTGSASFNIAGHPLYKGIMKVQASGQLLIGNFINTITQAPLFISLEVLPIRDQLYTGNLMGISRFDKSFSGKVYLSTLTELTDQLPQYRGSELTPEEINDLPKVILHDITTIFKNNRLERHFQQAGSQQSTKYIQHLVGQYEIEDTQAPKDMQSGLLSISAEGNSTMSLTNMHYEGLAMMSEGGILAIQFNKCNNIPHSGHIMLKVGRKKRSEISNISANWFHLNDSYEPITSTMIINSKD